MRILICGDRFWEDREKIAQQLRIVAQCIKHTQDYWGIELEDSGVNTSNLGLGVVIHGCNGYDEDGRLSYKSGKPTVRGADMIAREEALKLGFEVLDYPYPGELGRAGGPIRNQLQIDDGRPDLCLAFHSNLEESKGTKDMVTRARAAGVPTEVIV